MVLESDFQNHYNAAVALTEGKLSSYLVYKGLATAPWTAVGFLVLGGHEYVHWFLWNCLVLYPLTALFMFLAAVEVVGSRRVAALAPLMLALLPDYVHVSRLVATENVLLMGVSLAIWGYLRALRVGTLRSAALGGLCLAVCLHVKALLLLAIPFLVASFFLGGKLSFPFVRIMTGPRGRNLLRAALYASVTAVAVLPWSIYLYRQVGHPVAMAAYGERIAFSYNSPYGDRYYWLPLARAPELIPDFDPTRPKYDFSQHGDAARWYLRHHPQSVLRDLPDNFVSQFWYSGKGVAEWVYRNTRGGLPSYHTRGLERAMICLLLALGGLGFIAAGGAGVPQQARRSGCALCTALVSCRSFSPEVRSGIAWRSCRWSSSWPPCTSAPRCAAVDSAVW